jgi:lysozyme
LIRPGEDFSAGIDEQQLQDLLVKDLLNAETEVNDSVKVSVTQNQFDALVDLCFNIGGMNFANSTLVHLLNQGDYAGAAKQFLVWNKEHVNGILTYSQGLMNRREDEVALFNTLDVAA